MIKELFEGLAKGFGLAVGIILALYCLTHIPYIEELVKGSVEVISEWVRK